jgi:iron complex transport system substrate-binding protein
VARAALLVLLTWPALGCGPATGRDDAARQGASDPHAASSPPDVAEADDHVSAPGAGGPDGGEVAAGDSAAFPRTVDLGDGRTVTLATEPRRIVPANAATVDVVCALVDPQRVAGLPRPALPVTGLAADDPARERPLFSAYEAEPLLALSPDLVLSHTWQGDDTTARLREAGVTVVVLPDADTWPQVREQITRVGRLLGAEERAAALLAACDARVAALAARAAPLAGVRALCYSNGGAGGWVAGTGTSNAELLRLAGLADAAADADLRGHRPLTFEELLVIDPDLLVVGGTGEGQEGSATAALLRSEPSLASLSAVAHERIVVLPSRVYTTISQHLVDGAEMLQAEALEVLDATTESAR